ncbi:Shedu immune nuclease family protein, partial [Vibrio splendidus]
GSSDRNKPKRAIAITEIRSRRESLSEYEDMLNNADSYVEADWQRFFEANEWIFGYGLAYKYIEILQREAHISRSDLNGSNDVISDFLLSDSRFTKIVELKTPKTSLFENRRNRADSWRLSTALTDAVSQILAQKANWELEGANTNYTSEGNLIHEGAFDVECILVIGSHSSIDGTDRQKLMKSKTFELYRRNLRSIEILTYDELFERAKYIVEGSSEEI